MINEVFYNDILLCIFRKIKCMYRPCLVLVCKRWKHILDKHPIIPNEITIPLIYKRLSNYEMTTNCAEFLLLLNSKRDTRRSCNSNLVSYVLKNKITQLYNVLFIGETKFFINYPYCGNALCRINANQLEEIYYKKFCERFGVNPSEKGDREWVPKKRRRK